MGYTAALALLVFLLVGAVSVRQTTSQSAARHLIEEGIASLTDIDGLIAEQRPQLQQVVAGGNQASLTLPGYPLDIRFTRDEVLNWPDAQFRQLVLERSSAAIYVNGLSAFDQQGKQSISLFSTQGALESLVGWLSEDTYSAANAAAVILALLVAGLGFATVVRNHGFARVRAPGAACLIGGLAGYVLVSAVAWALGRLWGGDPFSNDLHTLIAKLTDVPRRNYLVTSLLGAGLLAIGAAAGLIAGRLPEPEDGTSFDPER